MPRAASMPHTPHLRLLQAAQLTKPYPLRLYSTPDHPPYSKLPPARRPITGSHPCHSPRRERHPRRDPFLPLSSLTVSLEITRDNIATDSLISDEARKIIHDPVAEWADMAHTKAVVSWIKEVVYAATLGVRWSVMGYDDTMLGLYNCEEIWYFMTSNEQSFRIGKESQLPDLTQLVEAAADFASYPEY